MGKYGGLKRPMSRSSRYMICLRQPATPENKSRPAVCRQDIISQDVIPQLIIPAEDILQEVIRV